MIDQTALATTCDDRWFYLACVRLSTYADSLGIEADVDELDRIADGYFESWMHPEPNKKLQFADELSAIFIKKIFEAKYGDVRDDE